jgi:arylsulfatase A-like enzyme
MPGLCRPLALAMIAAAAAAASPTPASGQASAPNIVVIMTDDAGYADFGAFGATDVRTPHIDGLARDGVRLTNFYANGPTCTPTRAGFISGRYQQRYELEWPLGAVPAVDTTYGLPPSPHSLPRQLQGAGYRTALIGKWHLGWKPAFSPLAHGFDEFFGFKSGYIDFYQHTYGTEADLFDGDSAVTVAGYMTDLIADRSIAFIERNAARPFFVDIAFNAPHWPYQVPGTATVARDNGRHLNAFDDSTSTRAEYVAMLEHVDVQVGRILAALDRLQLRENTLVIFTNDNGGEWLSHNGPFFHHKGSVWEGGIRVPTIVRWPARIAAGGVSHQAGITMDLTATMLAAAGVPRRPEAPQDGIDLLPILAGHAPEVERTLFWRVVNNRPQRAVRQGKWKLVFDGRPLLFDLEADPGERVNLIGRHAGVANRLRLLLDAWGREVDADAARRRTASGGG